LNAAEVVGITGVIYEYAAFIGHNPENTNFAPESS
jgi:hypothetical protein